MSKQEAEMQFGNHSEQLTSIFRDEIGFVSAALDCCSEDLCQRFGIARNCTLADLPTRYTGPSDYWDAMYSSPLTIAASFAESFMLQALSGIDYAWGRLSKPQLQRIYRMHDAVMSLASSRESSEAFGSALLAYVLSSFEQMIQGTALAGLVQPPSNALFLAIFAHDLNLKYLQRLVGARWFTKSWSPDSTPPGGYMTFELWAPGGEATPASNQNAASLSAEACRVRASFTSASFDQQRNAAPLTPPNEPPSVSYFLDMPYQEFKRIVISAVDRRCIAQPLRSTGMQQHDPCLVRSAATSLMTFLLTVELLAPNEITDSWLANRLSTISALAIFSMGAICVSCTCHQIGAPNISEQ